MKVLVATYKPSVRDEWQSPIDNHVDFKGFSHHYAGDFDKENPVKLPGIKPVEVLFASFQDLNGSEKPKWRQANDYHWDILVIDEEHYGVSAPVATETLSRLSFDKEIRLSGTPFKTLFENSFDDNEVFTWTYQDEQKKKKEDIEINGDKSVYRWLPQIEFHTFRISNRVKKAFEDAGYLPEEGFTMAKMFGVNPPKTKRFKSPGAVKKFLRMLQTDNDLKVLSNFDVAHSLWRLPGCRYAVGAMEEMLKSMPEYQGYNIVNVSGPKLNPQKALKKVKEAIKKGKPTITLTCGGNGRLTTGVTIKELNAVFMLDDGQAPEAYYQTAFRCQSMFEGQKEKCYVFDFNPERLLKKVYDYCVTTSKSNDETKAIREFLNYANVLEHNGNQLTKVSADDVLDLYDLRGGYIKKFSSARNINVDNVDAQVAGILSEQEKTAFSKIEKLVQTNEIVKGKNWKEVTGAGNGEIKEWERVKKDLMAKAKTVLAKLPNYLFVRQCLDKNVQDIISANKDIFNDITGVSVKDFNYMIDLGFLRESFINKNIASFVRAYQKIHATKRPIVQKVEQIVKLIDLLSAKKDKTKTPHSTVKKMLEQLSEDIWKDKSKTFYDSSMGRGVFLLECFLRLMGGLADSFPNENERAKHILKNMLFGSDNDNVQHQYAIAAFKMIIDNASVNLYNKSTLGENDLKFDIIATNPPYKAGMHLEFLKWALDHVKGDDSQIIFLHPSDWLLQKRKDGTRKQKLYSGLREKISKRGVTTTFIDNPWTFKEVQLILPLCITHVTGDKEVHHFDKRRKIYGGVDFSPVKHKVSHLDEVSQWFDGPVENEFVNKIASAAKQDNWKQYKEKGGGPHYVALSLLSANGNTELTYSDGKTRKISNLYSLGNAGTLEIYDEPPRAKPQGKKKVGNIKPWWSFKTKEEAQNAIDFIMKTKTIRAYLAIIKIDQNAANNIVHTIPYLDFSKRWNDEELAKLFNLSEQEINIVDKIVECISC